MIILSRFCLQKCMSRTTVFYKAKPKADTYMYSLRSSCFIKSQHSASQETLLWSWNSCSKAYLVTLAKIQDTQGHEVATSHLSCILSFDLIGQHQSILYITIKISTFYQLRYCLLLIVFSFFVFLFCFVLCVCLFFFLFTLSVLCTMKTSNKNKLQKKNIKAKRFMSRTSFCHSGS